MAEDFALAGLGQDDELVAEVATDRTRIGHHGNDSHAQSSEGPQIGDEHSVVAVAGPRIVEIERIGVLHQEFTAAHDAEPRPDLVPELPLDVIEIDRQILVRSYRCPENLCHHLFVGRPIEDVTLVTILDAQHFLTVVFVTTGFPP